ncbi:hypothetical protein [Streptomyces chumphonensis]|uniref:hypothetical protein n=1 Tax=Streptomyces chumphonensis TaxID=1214925 RepID=UPI003D726060
MRVRLTDGTRQVDITAPSTTPLPDLESTTLRLLAALTPDPEPTPPHRGVGFGQQLDGISLDSTIERSDQDDAPDLDDHAEGQATT